MKKASTMTGLMVDVNDINVVNIKKALDEKGKTRA